MCKRFIVLLGIFLGSQMPAVAQRASSQIVRAEERIAPNTTMHRTAFIPLPAASFLPYQVPGKSLAHASEPFAEDYESDHRLEHLPRLESFRTLFLTRSSLPLVRLWGQRLQLDVFHSTLHMQNVQFGPLAGGGLQDFRPPRQYYGGGPRSIDLTGVSLSFYFGRNSRTEPPVQTWRRLSRIFSTVLN